MSSLDDLTFRYTAVDRAGRQVQNVVRARDARAAARSLAAEGLTALSLKPEQAAVMGTSDRELSFAERVAVLRQLALMVEAGVGLLEAMQTVSPGVVAGKGRAQLEQVSAALKRGSAFGPALETYAPGFPFYVYAMLRVGEATGRIADVLKEASDQMAYEDGLRREFVNSMTYPAFLACAGMGAVTFIFTQVVPRFSAMLSDKRDKMPMISRIVLATGGWAGSHAVIVLGGFACVIAALVLAVTNKAARARLYDFGRGMPFVGKLLITREIAAWARLTGFAMSNGVGILEATALARRGVPAGPFYSGLEQFERDLKAGAPVDVSLGRHTPLSPMDLSLLRAGVKSGALPKMFLFIAAAYDARLKDALKRLTILIEPLTIGVVAVMVGTLAISIVLALTSVYDLVQ